MKNARRPVAAAINPRSPALWLAAAAVAATMTLSAGTARAESNFVNGAGTATARLNFSIVIPKFLYLQVGTGTYPTTVATIDNIQFDMSSAISSIGNGTAQSATSGGDISVGSVTARVVGNNFTAATNLQASTAGAMTNGAGGTISWSEIVLAAAPTAITVVPAAAAVLNHPGSVAAPFVDGGNTTVSLTPVNRVINQAAKWTFQYKNTNVPASGSYGAAGSGTNGQVTYQIIMP
ncbi:MAG: hypothetical protein U1F15_02090 [Burkholderiales bacterium]